MACRSCNTINLTAVVVVVEEVVVVGTVVVELVVVVGGSSVIPLFALCESEVTVTTA